MRYIGLDTATAVQRLAGARVEWHTVGDEGSDAERALIDTFLAEGERQLRGTFDAEPPAVGEEHQAHCAWHTNAVDEVHTFLSGTGRFEFATPDGVIAVVAEAGDVMVNRGAEHRYLPLTSQRLRLRHSGPPDGDFGYVATTTPNDPWSATE
ncbi:hypothetical protein [Longivirga aurantiaca]|uniref:Cupin domain-containing protein n=1 Tax=Longivirga aurantiaca TaxID=1837743 RepID=A0ABW1SYB6_9ACTN